MKSLDSIGSAFLRKILRRMKELGVNQTQLAERLHIARPYVTKVLNGQVHFTFASAYRFAKALKMDFFPELRIEGENVADESVSRSKSPGRCAFFCPEPQVS